MRFARKSGMTPAEIANLTDPAKIRRIIRHRERVMTCPISRELREYIHREIAALEERHLEITGEEWRA